MRRSTALLSCLLLALVTEAARRHDVWWLLPAAGAALVGLVLVVSVVGRATKDEVR